MDPLSLASVASMSSAALVSGDPDALTFRVSKDTRTLRPGDLYVALQGERYDGNAFLQEAASRGAVGAICDKEPPAGLPPDFAILSTPDSLSALALLASSWRDRLNLRPVVITGSSGKTSVKDLTATVLRSRLRVTATFGNLNNHIGLPLTILEAGSGDEVGVWEIGMNHRGEIAPLAGMARPEIGIITGIGTAHLENLGSREEIAREKGDLLEKIPKDGLAILPAGDDFVSELESRTEARVMKVGFDSGELRASRIVAENGGSRFGISGDFGAAEAWLPVPGRHMVGNALLAVAAGLILGIPLEECARALSHSELTSGRLSRLERGGVTFLDDSYNANPDSMKAALVTLASLPCSGRRIAVLGRMGELGIHAAAGYEDVGRAAARTADLLVCVGHEAHSIGEAARDGGLEKILLTNDNDGAATLLTGLVKPGDIVLVKASRSARMEEILNHFT
jgi:UDP-N-acetylmuramoyl-tripeptide--D-alanyl-D-alanine ligase